MAGGHVAYRHLSRDSAARQALLRGLVTQLVQYEHLHTTYAKAKEAQRMAEKLITLAKRDSEPSRRSIQAMLYTPDKLMPKVLGLLKERYATRAGGATRVTRTEPKNVYDQGESAILEFVDGPKDTRFMMAAKAIARDRSLNREPTVLTKLNQKKATQFRKNGEAEFEAMVQRYMTKKAHEDMAEDADVWKDHSGKEKVEDGEATYEVEAREWAEREGRKTKWMGSFVVPDRVKAGASSRQAKTV